MKKILVLMAAMILGAVGVAQAAVLDFEDTGNMVPYGITGEWTLPNGYHGFNWVQGMALDWNLHGGYAGSGYEYGTFGKICAFNAFGNTMTMTDGTFDFNGAYITAAWSAIQHPIIEGWLNGVLKYTTTITTDNTAAHWFNFDYTGIDTLVFNSNDGNQLAIDNLTYNAAVPEPATMLLLGSGLLGLAGYGRKKFFKK